MTHFTDWHSLPHIEAGDFYRYPRTVVQAFPTALNHDVCLPYEPMPTRDKLVTAICTVIALGLMLAMAKGWL